MSSRTSELESPKASGDAIESFADRIQHVMGLADHVAELSPFQQWLAENGAEIEFDQGGDPKRLRVDTILSKLKYGSFENVATIAAEALEKWSKSGNDPAVLRQAELTWKTPGGGTEVGFVGAIAFACNDVDTLVAAARRVLERDDLTLKQRREIAETLSTKAVSFDVETEVAVQTKGEM